MSESRSLPYDLHHHVGFVTCTTKSDWLATVTGRIGGVVADRTLVYAKGGAAWMHSSDSIGVPGVFESRSSTTPLGWVLGLGAEYAFDHNWSAFIEYNYIEFDKKTVVWDLSPLAGGVTTIANVDIKNKLSIAKIGVNYKFGGPVVARY